MHWGSGIFGCSPCFTHFYFFAQIFSHFHHIYSFSRLIDMVIHFDGACCRTSYLPPHFSGPFSPWILVLGKGCSIPAPMACDQDMGHSPHNSGSLSPNKFSGIHCFIPVISSLGCPFHNCIGDWKKWWRGTIMTKLTSFGIFACSFGHKNKCPNPIVTHAPKRLKVGR